ETEQVVWRRALDHPALDLAVIALDVHVNPRVWVDQLPFDDRAFQGPRLIGVELRAEGVMRTGRGYGQGDERRRDKHQRSDLHVRSPTPTAFRPPWPRPRPLPRGRRQASSAARCCLRDRRTHTAIRSCATTESPPTNASPTCEGLR